MYDSYTCIIVQHHRHVHVCAVSDCMHVCAWSVVYTCVFVCMVIGSGTHVHVHVYVYNVHVCTCTCMFTEKNMAGTGTATILLHCRKTWHVGALLVYNYYIYL